MVKLKNISSEDVILNDLGMQLLHPQESIDLDSNRKFQACDSSQIIQLVSNSIIIVIDNDGYPITNISLAIDTIKGFAIQPMQTFDKKLWVQSTARPIGTFTCFTSEGDAQDNPLETGDGTKMMIEHQIGQSLEQHLYIDFNVKENKTYISEGIAFFKATDFDELHMNIVPKLTPYIAGTNTYFNLYGGFLILPAAGDGNIQVDPAQIILVEIPYSIDDPTVRQSAAFWDADYSFQTHTFSNLRPNIYGTGQYNIFGAEINFETVVDLVLLGDGQMHLRSNDVAEFAHGMRIKFTFKTNQPDHNWKCCLNLTMSREHSAEN